MKSHSNSSYYWCLNRVISADDDEVTSTEHDVWNLSQDTSDEEDLETEWLQFKFQVLQDETSSLWELANIMQIHINDLKDANFPVKLGGLDTTYLYDTGVIQLLVLYMLYKIERSSTFAKYTCNDCTF